MKIRTLLLACLLNTAFAAEHFNILVYHHVSENTPASTSVSPQTFREHLQFFADSQYNLISLEDGLSAIRSGQSLPENSLAITFDDGYRNLYDNAWPLLEEFNAPFTVFVSTDAIDQGFKDMMTWQQMREMKASGAVFANHTRDHDYLVRRQNFGQSWVNVVTENIEYAQNRLTDELGADTPNWLAYPYGEFNTILTGVLADLNFIGFAQHSGGVWSGSNMQAIPRFSAAGIYSNLATLQTKIESHPMPVDESQMTDMLTTNTQPSAVITLTNTQNMNTNLNCFIDGQTQAAQWQTDLQFKLTSAEPLSKGRHRYNCTAAAIDGDYFYWYSKPWLVYTSNR